MAFEDSPKLKDYDKGAPVRSPEGDKKRKAVVRGFIICLSLIVASIGIFRFQRSDTFANLAGEGSNAGMVVDHQGAPYPAEIAISGTNISSVADEGGQFEIQQVPSGEQGVIFLNDQYGWEQKVNVQRGQTTHVGTITIPDIDAEPWD